MPKSLSEILDELTNSLPIKATEVGWEKVGEDVQQAQSLIYQAMLKVIGLDGNDFDGSNTQDNFQLGQNKLRQEQRLRLKRFIYGKETS